MRTTSSMMVSTLLNNLDNLRKRIGRHQTKLATAKRINRPSDDPSGISGSLHLNSVLKGNEQYLRNIQDATERLSFTENRLGSLNSLLTDLRALTVQGASETLSIDEREALALQANQYLEQLLSEANARFKGSYIFGGTQTRTAPYVVTRDETGEVVSVNRSGNTSGEIYREIDEGETLQINVTGEGLFEGPISAFQVLIDLRQALRDDDTGAIGDSLDKIDQILERVTELRSEVGAKLNRLQMAKNRLEDDNLLVGRAISDVEDVDIAEAIIDLQKEQTVYQAALVVASQIDRLNLIDLL